MKTLLVSSRPQHKVAAELLSTSKQLFRIRLCLWLLTGLLLLCPGLLQAQTYNGDITLRSQEQVNAFNYTDVTGTLYIQGTGITDLRPLAELTKVGGHLNLLGNASLSSLAGLENLTSVGGEFNLDGNGITSLAGLESLTSVGGLLAIDVNDNLTSLAGLEKLTSVGEFFIRNNYKLTSLAGLENLTSVGGNLFFDNNSSLTSLVGLENLTSVGGELAIANNSNLTSLAGLEHITSVGRDLYISYNAKLSQCGWLLPIIQVTEGQVIIFNNAPNCNSEAEIRAAYTPVITTQPQAATLCAGQKATFSVAATGPDLSYQWRKNGTDIAGATANTYVIAAVSAADAATYSVVVGPYAAVISDAASLTVKPALTLGEVTAPAAPIAVNTTVSLSVPFSGSSVSSASWNWGDGSTSPATINGNTLSGSHKYTKAGTYSPILTVTDACGQTTSTPDLYVVVSETSPGCITGIGSFTSPKKAYKADSKLTGKAGFGLYARFKKGTSTPEGSTLFAFKAGNVKLTFGSTVYESLTISGQQALYKGKGKIDGKGNYGFLVSLLDGRPDKFRIKIWNKDKGNAVVCDNNISNTAETADPATALSGFILIKGSQGNARESVNEIEEPLAQASFKNYPNPFSDKTTLEFRFDQDQDYTLAIYNMQGDLVTQLPSGKAQADERVQIEWQAANQPAGIYLARLTTRNSVQHVKLIIE